MMVMVNYQLFEDLFKAPIGRTFWAGVDGSTGHPDSYYAPLPRGYIRSAESPFSRDSSLCFDISNQYIQASVDIEGTLQDVCSASGALTPYHGPMRGVYVQKEVINGGPWRIDINTIEDLPYEKHIRRDPATGNWLSTIHIRRFSCHYLPLVCPMHIGKCTLFVSSRK
jgi:hypothetical protein